MSICPGGSAQNPSMNDSQSGNAVPPTSSHRLPPGNSSSLVPPPRLPIGNVNTTSMYCDSAYSPVLLQTARTRVFKVGFPKTTLEVRMIFDSGSQRSYITNSTSVRELLNLDSKSTETMLIKTFGSARNDKQTCDIVLVGMLLKDGGFYCWNYHSTICH